MKARTAVELRRRCNTLLTLVELLKAEVAVDKLACTGILTTVVQQKAQKRKRKRSD